jgi:transcriptional regulator with XRE-family HTH domain
MQPYISSLEGATDSCMDDEIGPRIRELRRQKRLTQDGLGKLVGLPGDVVSKQERGVLGVGLQRLFAYASVFGVPPERLAGKSARRSADEPDGSATGVHRAIVALLNDGRCNPIGDVELADLSKHLAEGNSGELIDLEIHLLAHRAEREQTDEALSKFRAAVLRKRKEKQR